MCIRDSFCRAATSAGLPHASMPPQGPTVVDGLALGQSCVSGRPKFRFDYSTAPHLDFEKVLMKSCFVTAFGFENKSTKICAPASAQLSVFHTRKIGERGPRTKNGDRAAGAVGRSVGGGTRSAPTSPKCAGRSRGGSTRSRPSRSCSPRRRPSAGRRQADHLAIDSTTADQVVHLPLGHTADTESG
eukprot:2263225-Prymnesium_polylepis.1